MNFHRLSAAPHREILTLIDGAECSHEEAAKIRGCSVESSRRTMKEARARLAKLIDTGAERKQAARPWPSLAPISH
jgi:DNA-directed RNA polymerase specialized sigma24 family protein